MNRFGIKGKYREKEKENPPHKRAHLTLFDTDVDLADHPYCRKDTENSRKNGHRFTRGGKERIGVLYL